MRILFLGTPDFAVASLAKLVENGMNVVGVVTAPDKPAGRGQQLQESAVKKYAVENGLKVLQPEKLKDPVFLEELKALEPDLGIVVAFRMLPESVWNLPPLGTFNLHGSLLPRYRGAAPINWAVINGEKETGVTTFFLKQEIDTGDIIFTEKTAIDPNESAGAVHDRLMGIGADLVLRTAQAVQNNDVKSSPQNLSGLSEKELAAPKLFKEDCKIDWNKSCLEIHNRIRGLSPYPTAYTEWQGQSIKIFTAYPESCVHSEEIGSLHTDGKKYLKIACSDGYIQLTDLQLQGKKRMQVAEFLRGFRMA